MQNIAEVKVAGVYKICSKLGKGSFGEVYQGINIKKQNDVAIKMEKLKLFQPMLEYEAKLYSKLQGQPGFATVHWYGVEGDFKVLVIDMLGPSLNDLFDFCD